MKFKISCLLFIKNQQDQILMLQRRKSPNRGFWSPPGGKLKMEEGESPFECAQREAKEETGLNLGFSTCICLDMFQKKITREEITG